MPPHKQSDERLRERRTELISRSPWKADIFLPTDKIELEQQLLGLERVVDINDNRLFQKYSKELQALRDRYQHSQRCFIIGNGPSLNETDLSQLEDEVTFCVNGFFLKLPELSWVPTFYVVEDHLVAEDRAQEINALKGPTKLFPAYLAYCLDEGPDTIFYNHRGRLSYPDGFDFSTDASKVTYTGCTVTFSCMQLAHYMGFREIYLVGVDASYEIPKDVNQANTYGTGVLDMDSDDPNHFHPDYFGKGYRWHDPQVDKMIDAYEEARRTTDALNRPILNATVGGELEVFKRRDFSDIFPSALSAHTLRALKDQNNQQEIETLQNQARISRHNTHTSKFPKVALIDMTPAAGVSASGALKASLFADWPRARLLQISSDNGDEICIEGGPIALTESHVVTRSPHLASQIIAAFDADVLLYRPLPERPILQRVYEIACEVSGASRVVWIMDDWPAKMNFEGNPEAEYWTAKLRKSLQEAKACFSISDAMSNSFKQRYSSNFTPISNGIDPESWRPKRPKASRPFRVRYAGSLSESMSLNTLLELAAAIECLGEVFDLRFEIKTSEHWAELHSAKFKSFRFTSMSSATLTNSEYRSWLMEAHISVIAYNFDDLSKSYVRYSMANKLPELLASGSVLLAIGPEDINTINYLSSHELGVCVTEGGALAIQEALGNVLGSVDGWDAIIEKQKNHANTHFCLTDIRNLFSQQIRQAAMHRRSNPVVARKALLDFLTSPNYANSNREAANMAKKNGQLDLSKPRRMLKFYAGWRGIVASASIVLSALPSLSAFFRNEWVTMAIMMGPVLAILLIIAFIAYLFTVLEDHYYQ